jgi:hypothetical protein
MEEEIKKLYELIEEQGQVIDGLVESVNYLLDLSEEEEEEEEEEEDLTMEKEP